MTPTADVLCNGFANCGAGALWPIIMFTIIAGVVLVVIQLFTPDYSGDSE